MPIPRIGQRLAAIEAALANDVPTCVTCQKWPAIFIRFRDEQGAMRPAVSADGWPPEAAACPDCGRRPGNLITIGVDPRGPA